jgi:hypothetical protein
MMDEMWRSPERSFKVALCDLESLEETLGDPDRIRTCARGLSFKVAFCNLKDREKLEVPFWHLRSEESEGPVTAIQWWSSGRDLKVPKCDLKEIIGSDAS